MSDEVEYELVAIKVSDVIRRFADKLDEDGFEEFARTNGAPSIVDIVNNITTFCSIAGYDVRLDKLVGYQPNGSFVESDIKGK